MHSLPEQSLRPRARTDASDGPDGTALTPNAWYAAAMIAEGRSPIVMMTWRAPVSVSMGGLGRGSSQARRSAGVGEGRRSWRRIVCRKACTRVAYPAEPPWPSLSRVVWG